MKRPRCSLAIAEAELERERPYVTATLTELPPHFGARLERHPEATGVEGLMPPRTYQSAPEDETGRMDSKIATLMVRRLALRATVD